MPETSDPTALKTLPSSRRVHVVGAGPVGLLLTALLQPMEGFSVRLYEKRHEYTRTRMVQLAPYLVADSVESYRTDHIDGDNVEAVFDPAELDEGLAFRQSIPSGPDGASSRLDTGVLPAQRDRARRQRSDRCARVESVQRTAAVVTAEDAIAMLEPGDILIDCTGQQVAASRSPVPGSGEADGGANTLKIRLEYALVITFLYGQTYDCNEYCKYYKNAENAHYKFIPDGPPHVLRRQRQPRHGHRQHHAEDYEAMPSRFDGQWLREQLSRRRRVDGPLHRQDQGGDARRDPRRPRDRPDPARPVSGSQCDQPAVARSGAERPSVRQLAGVPVGDSAIGSPYFQSISLGFECAMFLAGLIAQRDLPLRDMLDRYELYIYKQWLRVYMRSKMIKHNKDLFESVDDPLALLDKLHIY